MDAVLEDSILTNYKLMLKKPHLPLNSKNNPGLGNHILVESFLDFISLHRESNKTQKCKLYDYITVCIPHQH